MFLLILCCISTISFCQSYSNRLSVNITDALDKVVHERTFTERVGAIQVDTAGNVWFGTDAGLFRYDGRQYKQILSGNSGLLSSSIEDLKLDLNGNLWVGSLGYGLQEFNPYTEEFTTYEVPVDLKKYPSRTYHLSQSYGDGYLLCAMDRTFGLFSTAERKFVKLFHENMVDEQIDLGFVRCIEPDPSNKDVWWLGTTSSLFKFDSRDTSFVKVKHKDNHLNGVVRVLSIDDQGRVIFADNQGTIYMHTNGDKPRKIIDLFHTIPERRLVPDVIAVFGNDLFVGDRTTASYVVKDYATQPRLVKNIPSGDRVSSILLDSYDRLWLGHKSGFSVYNPKYDIVKKVSLLPKLKKSTLILDAEQWSLDEQLYVAVGQREGLYEVDPKTGSVRVYLPKSTIGRNSFFVRGLAFDSDGFLWLSSNVGLYRFDTRSKTFSKEMLCENIESKNLGRLKSKDGKVLICSSYRPHRLLYFDISTKTYKEHHLVGEDSCKLPLLRQLRDFDYVDKKDVWIAGRPYIINHKTGCSDEYQLPDSLGIDVLGAKCINVDDRGKLYIGYGSKGLVAIDVTKSSHEYKRYGIDNGLRTDRVLSIESDHYGSIWLVSGAGLIYSRDLGEFERITLPDIGNDEYLHDPRTFKMLHSGRLALGGSHSILLLDIDKARINLKRLKPKIQSVTWDDTHVVKWDKSDRSLLRIPHKHHNIQVYLSDFNFGRQDGSSFYYRLSNMQDRWQQLDQATISFYNLSSGSYTLEVATDNGGSINDELITTLQFEIAPPWYFRIWAWIVWIFLLAVLIAGLFRYLLKRQMVAQKLAHVEHIKELQNKLFTNITHELRTPLSLIIGSSQSLTTDNVDLNKSSIETNARVLKDYVDQLLDLSSIDAGKSTMQKSKVDVIKQLRLIVEAFDSMAVSKEITIHQLYEGDSLIMDLDVMSFRKIINNLIHNALKFTDNEGHVYVSASAKNDRLYIEVRDTGRGIEEKHLPFIFDRYYKTFDLEENLGSGIGMALTKELVDMLDGSIEVTSQVGKGTVFSIELPVTNNSTQSSDFAEVTVPALSHNVTVASDSNRKVDQELLYVVEDNVEMNGYISSIFSDDYAVMPFFNGEDGYNEAVSNPPTLIISDVMMPKMDGYQLLHHVKGDWRVCDIPVILLTAKADKASRIEGITEGADAYLAKPFDEDELRAVVKNLIENRKRAKTTEVSEKTESVISELEKKLRSIIEAHLEDTDLTVDFIAQEMGLSRITLYRDVKQELGMSPSKFIKQFKLNKAASLLSETDLRVSEIAFKVGFTDPSYFTRVFKSAMGVSPQDFRAKK